MARRAWILLGAFFPTAFHLSPHVVLSGRDRETMLIYFYGWDRLRNHDLLTSLDVLTTGSYRRLPSAIKVCVPFPLSLTSQSPNVALTDRM
jgi:hypothetical protein